MYRTNLTIFHLQTRKDTCDPKPKFSEPAVLLQTLKSSDVSELKLPPIFLTIQLLCSSRGGDCTAVFTGSAKLLRMSNWPWHVKLEFTPQGHHYQISPWSWGSSPPPWGRLINTELVIKLCLVVMWEEKKDYQTFGAGYPAHDTDSTCSGQSPKKGFRYGLRSNLIKPGYESGRINGLWV